MKTMSSRMGFAVTTIVVALLALATQSANAQLGQLTVIVGGSSFTTNTSTGQATFSGTLGAWNVIVNTGTTGPNFIDINSDDLSTPGTSTPIEVLWSVDGYTSGQYLAATGGGTLTPGVSAVLSSYYGAESSTATPLTSSMSFGPYGTTTGFSGTTPVGTATGASPFWLTEEIYVSGATAADSQAGMDFTLTAVPEPATLSLGLIGVAAAAARRFKKSKNA